MKNPKIKTKVVHSETNNAWNIIGTTLAKKHKIARVPYVVINDLKTDILSKSEALEHALFISECFNNSDEIVKLL